MRMTSVLGGGAIGALLAFAPAPRPAEAAPKYYFKIVEVNTGPNKDLVDAKMARELLEKDLAGRAEFTADIGGASDGAAVVAALKKRNLRGFRISLRIDKLDKEIKEPKPGGRLKQLGVGMKLSVFGTQIPGEKLAFSGDGEAMVEAEVVERRADEEAVPMIKDVMAQALKQAVDQAVMKLSIPKSAPMNESKRKRKR